MAGAFICLHTRSQYVNDVRHETCSDHCPVRIEIDRLISTKSMSTNDSESHSAELPDVTLCWAFDDEGSPTEVTVFDPQNEITTRWITIDEDYVCDLGGIA